MSAFEIQPVRTYSSRPLIFDLEDQILKADCSFHCQNFPYQLGFLANRRKFDLAIYLREAELEHHESMMFSSWFNLKSKIVEERDNRVLDNLI